MVQEGVRLNAAVKPSPPSPFERTQPFIDGAADDPEQFFDPASGAGRSASESRASSPGGTLSAAAIRDNRPLPR